MTLFQSWFWPDVGSQKNALAAINETFWVMMFLAAMSGVFTFNAGEKNGGNEAPQIKRKCPAHAVPIAAGTPSIADSFRSFRHAKQSPQQESERK